MDTIKQNLDILLYIIENGVIGLLIGDVFLLIAADKKNNKHYNIRLMVFHTLLLLASCLIIFLVPKPYPLYEIAEIKKPLLALGAATIAGVLWTCFLGIRKNIVSMIITPLECICFLAVIYVIRMQTIVSRSQYMVDFDGFFDRIAVGLILISIFLIFTKYRYWRRKHGMQIYLTISVFGLCFLSEPIKDFVIKYLPILVGIDLLWNLLEYLVRHRRKSKRHPHRKPARRRSRARKSAPAKTRSATQTRKQVQKTERPVDDELDQDEFENLQE